jgi:hypothetical protein
VSVLDRVRAALLRRELASLQSADHAERDQAFTTDDMMAHIVDRATRIVKLQNRIRELEGEEPEDPDTDFDPRTPSSLFIPTRGES